MGVAANPQRGEVVGVLDGTPRLLRLTLGSLAELEAELSANDLAALAERFERGSLSAREASAVIAAGLRGAGGAETTDEVSAMAIDGGAAGAMRLVAETLKAGFGG